MRVGIMCLVVLLLIFSLPRAPLKADTYLDNPVKTDTYLDYEAPTRDRSLLNQGLPVNPEPALKICAGVGAAMKCGGGFAAGSLGLAGIYPGGCIPWYIRALSS